MNAYLELSLMSGNDGIYVFAMLFVLVVFAMICGEAYSRVYGSKRSHHRHHRHEYRRV